MLDARTAASRTVAEVPTILGEGVFSSLRTGGIEGDTQAVRQISVSRPGKRWNGPWREHDRLTEGQQTPVLVGDLQFQVVEQLAATLDDDRGRGRTRLGQPDPGFPPGRVAGGRQGVRRREGSLQPGARAVEIKGADRQFRGAGRDLDAGLGEALRTRRNGDRGAVVEQFDPSDRLVGRCLGTERQVVEIAVIAIQPGDDERKQKYVSGSLALG